MVDKEDRMKKWVVLVKNEMVLMKCRPELPAGGAVSCATLRQGKAGKAAPRLARVCLQAKLFVCKANVRSFFLRSILSSSRISTFSAKLSATSRLNRVDLVFL